MALQEQWEAEAKLRESVSSKNRLGGVFRAETNNGVALDVSDTSVGLWAYSSCARLS